MGKTFEALNRADEQRRFRFNLTPVDDNGFEKGKLTLLLSHEVNTLFPRALNQNGSMTGPPLTKGGWGDFWGNMPFWFRRGRVRVYDQKLNQMEQAVDELNKMISALISSIKHSIRE